MNARGSGVISRESRVFDKSAWKDFQSQGKEIQSQGKRNPSFFLPRIGTFQGLVGESTRSGRRRRARTREDAPPQRLATRVEPRLLRKSRPAIHARLASGRTRSLFWEPRAAITQIWKIGNKNRMGQCACRRKHTDNKDEISPARPAPGSTAFTHSTGGRFPFPSFASGPENVETRKPRGTRSTKRDFNLL